MSSKPSFCFSTGSYGEFDAEEKSSGSSSGSSEQDKDDKAVMLSTIPTNANHLLLVALLEHVCSLYITQPNKKDKLFKLLCKQLAQMNIMSPLGGLDELGAIRIQYKKSFAKLLTACVANLNLTSSLSLPSPSQDPLKLFTENRLPMWYQPKPALSDFMNFHTSRYRDEYEELNTLGKGAYGCVYKAKHKLDGKLYAVKKVVFQDNTPDMWSKTLREVKHLADLNHSSIIRYYTAWLEYQLPLPLLTDVPVRSTDDINLPALTYDVKKDRETDEASSHSDGLSIVFEDGSLGVSPHPAYNRHASWEPSATDRSRSRSHLLDTMYVSSPASVSHTEDLLIQHSHVVLHIQMELCEQTLQDWLLHRNLQITSSSDVYKYVDEDTNLYILREVLHGVAHLQRNNLLHRDIKPSNIFLNGAIGSDGLSVKIGDFGLVRQRSKDESGKTDVPPCSPMTPAPGIMEEVILDMNGACFLTSGVGTTIYASPEQLAGADYGPQSDMYSIGLILLELYHPFCTGMERSKTLMNAKKGVIPEDFTQRWPKLSDLIRSLTHENPEKRPTAEDILDGPLYNMELKTIDALQEELTVRDHQLETSRERIRQLESLLAAKDKEIQRLKMLVRPTLDEQGDVDR